MLRTRFTLSVLLAGSILVVAPKAVNPGEHHQHHRGRAVQQADGSPMPVPQPNPPGGAVLVADGSPMPVPQPNPPGDVLVADGSPDASTTAKPARRVGGIRVL
jgi:hypothetical protein